MEISEYFKKRANSKIKNPHILDDGLLSYINKQINSNEKFSNIQDSEFWGRKLLLPTMNLFDASYPLDKKIIPFKGPYLWGKLFYSTSEIVEKVVVSMHYQKSMDDMNYNDYKTTIHHHISDLERYLEQEISLRSYQREWLNKPSDYFIGLIENYRVNETFPYEYLAFFWDRDTNEQYMSILWNKGEKKDESEKPIIF